MVALPLLSDPTPRAIEDLVGTLQPEARSTIAWFPAALRATLVAPLSATNGEQLRSTLDRVAVPSIRLFLRLFRALGSEPELFEILLRRRNEERDIAARHSTITRRLEPIAPVAAAELSEALEWFRAIVVSAARQSVDHSETALGPETSSISDENIRAELDGRAGSFWRALLLIAGALDVVFGSAPLPQHIGVWIRLTLRELHAAANMLRADGLPLPTRVHLPEESGRRRAPEKAMKGSLLSLHPSGPCPTGVLERIVEVLAPARIWLFGSRARGTANADSDWDLLVVLPDDSKASLEDREAWAALRDVRRRRVDLHTIAQSDFDANLSVSGTLAQIAASEGVVVYER